MRARLALLQSPRRVICHSPTKIDIEKPGAQPKINVDITVDKMTTQRVPDLYFFRLLRGNKLSVCISQEKQVGFELASLLLGGSLNCVLNVIFQPSSSKLTTNAIARAKLRHRTCRQCLHVRCAAHALNFS